MLIVQRAVGDHIQSLPGRQGDSERRLWSFVSSFTENKMDGDKLQKLYVKLKANKAAPSGVQTHAVCFVLYVLWSSRPAFFSGSLDFVSGMLSWHNQVLCGPTLVV